MSEKINLKYQYEEVLEEEGEILPNGLNMQANNVESLGKIKEVRGFVYLRSDSLENLGELQYVEGDLVIADCPKLTSLSPLREVTGTLNLVRSSIESLGSLKFVGGRLNLQGKPNIDFSELIEVGSVALSKKLKFNDLGFKYERVSYYKDPLDDTTLNSVGGHECHWMVLTISEYNKAKAYHGTPSNSKSGYWVRNNKYAVEYRANDNSSNEQSPYFKPQNILDQENIEYGIWKNKLLNDNSIVRNIRGSKNLTGFRNRLFYDLFKDLAENSISLESGLKKILCYKNAFDPKYYPEYDLKRIVLKEGLFNDSVNEVLLGNTMNFGELHTLETRLKKRQLDASKMIKWKSSLSSHTQENLEEFTVFVDKKIESLYNNSYSFMWVLFNIKDSVKDINKEFRPLKSQFKSSVRSNWYGGMEEFEKFLIESAQVHPISKYLPSLLGAAENEDVKVDLLQWNKPYHENIFNVNPHDVGPFNIFLENIIRKFLDVIFSAWDNDFRVSKGLPKIGDGWISETELYHKLRDKFNKTEVIQHARIDWLGRQHVDVYFPKHKIGVEYQGAQHDRPIEFFGGEEAFKKNQERDERKRVLFAQNNAHLIEVRPGYDFEDLVFQITKLLKKKV